LSVGGVVVIEAWGVKVFYKYGGKLVREWTKKPLGFEIIE